MSVQFNLCGNLCEELNVKTIMNIFKKRNDKYKIQYVVNDINRLLADSSFDRNYICNHILNKLVQLTQSEYGFIGKIIHEENGPVLHTYSITNIAWNASSQKFFLDHINTSLRFENMNTLFGDVILSGKYKICNKYDMSRSILPAGHPMVRRFMGVPCVLGDKNIIMAGFCNKINKFVKKDVTKVTTILNILAYLFIDISRDTTVKEIMSCPIGKIISKDDV